MDVEGVGVGTGFAKAGLELRDFFISPKDGREDEA